jgi:hypothetical protein
MIFNVMIQWFHCPLFIEFNVISKPCLVPLASKQVSSSVLPSNDKSAIKTVVVISML